MTNDRTHWEDCWKQPNHHACVKDRFVKLEAWKAERDKSCVWLGTKYPPKFCSVCGHPVKVEEEK